MVWLALLAIPAVLVFGCNPASQPSVEASDSYTVAFLRAVPGTRAVQSSFLATLRREGYVVETNLTVLAADEEEAYPEQEDAEAAVRQWQQEGVDLIVALSTVGARAAEEAAPDVNTLFLANDPIATGLVKNAETPGGSLTGVTFRVPADRTLDLIRRAIPGESPIGLAYPPADSAGIAHRDEVLAAAEELGVSVIVEPFADADEVGESISKLADRGAGALLLSTSPTATRALEEFRGSAGSAGLPTIANTPLVPWAILSLYPDSEEIGRQLARQAVRLLSGSSPAAIPVEDPRQLILELNAVAAAEHGIEFSDDLMREADRVTVP